jgi:hypothetical protein
MQIDIVTTIGGTMDMEEGLPWFKDMDEGSVANLLAPVPSMRDGSCTSLPAHSRSRSLSPQRLIEGRPKRACTSRCILCNKVGHVARQCHQERTAIRDSARTAHVVEQGSSAQLAATARERHAALERARLAAMTPEQRGAEQERHAALERHSKPTSAWPPRMLGGRPPRPTTTTTREMPWTPTRTTAGATPTTATPRTPTPLEWTSRELFYND